MMIGLREPQTDNFGALISDIQLLQTYSLEL